MARVLWVEDEERAHPGCMSGIFHALDYNYWHSNVKKIIPHRRHEELVKHARRNGRYRRISDDEDPFEVIRLLDAKTSHIQVDRRNRKTSSTRKRSLKARIKALVSEDYKDEDYVPSPKLHRTYSIHHLESNEWVHPIIFYPESVTDSPVSPTTHSNVTCSEVNKSQDILDMLEVDKDVFINTLQDRPQASVLNPQLTKSGSFPMKLKDKLNEIYTIPKSANIKNLNDDGIRLRRISSLNESADRYTRLFDFGVAKEATLRSSRSLKLSNERSMVSLSVNKDVYAELKCTQDCESLNEVIDKSGDFLENEDSPKDNSLVLGKDSHGLEIDEGEQQISQEIIQQSSVRVPDFCPSDEKVQFSQGLNLISNSHENLKKEIKTMNSKKHMALSIKDDDFTYVKKVLEQSGFLKNGLLQTWYSSKQPLDSFTFQELESQYVHDPERFAEEINELSHRLLIFDLVDEVLLSMHERSSTLYPKKLSSFCRIRLAPSGARFLDEVWNRVSQMINLKHDVNESLNDIVSRDLRCDGGWMNLWSDSECVGLDLEDLILDEVLEELLFDLFWERDIDKQVDVE